MLILNHKKGFTLTEVVCSAAMCFIFACAIFSLLSNITLNRNYYNKSADYILCLEAIHNKICYVCSNNDIKAKYADSDKTYFINKTDVDINKIKDKNISDLLSTARIPDSPYIEINIINKDAENDIFQLNLKLHYIYNGREQLINYHFLKGKY